MKVRLGSLPEELEIIKQAKTEKKSGVEKLTHLSLNGCLIVSIPNNSFVRLESAVDLDLGYNSIDYPRGNNLKNLCTPGLRWGVFFGLENLNFDRRKDKLKCEKIQRKPQKKGEGGCKSSFLRK
jgi:hypothetical protein